MRIGFAYHRDHRGPLGGLKAKVARTRDRFTSLMLLLTANALSVVILMLAFIGAPPRWRIDVLWVNKHSDMVRIAIIALAIAVCTSTLVLLWRRPRGLMLAIWILAAAVAFAFFNEQLMLIYAVLQRHGW